jgi:hypothetical protein
MRGNEGQVFFIELDRASELFWCSFQPGFSHSFPGYEGLLTRWRKLAGFFARSRSSGGVLDLLATSVSLRTPERSPIVRRSDGS